MQEPQVHTHSPLLKRSHTFFKGSTPYLAIIPGLLVWMIFVSFCLTSTDGSIAPKKENFKYDLDSPVDRYKLPSYLEEISGLSYYGKGKIACVQDEKAFIYVLNLEKEEIIDKYDFGDDGDYEDIAIVNKTAYILKNNGTIYRVKDFKKKDRKVKKYPTELKEKNDAEGMAYDSKTNALLIACKGSPSIGKENSYEGYRAIYMFDLEKKKLVPTPHFLIESETSFKPSGIAIHPLDGEIYIISSVGKLLIILNREGKVKDVKELDPEKFIQPEGICFSPKGDMFISSEGQGKKGYILKFEVQAKP